MRHKLGPTIKFCRREILKKPARRRTAQVKTPRSCREKNSGSMHAGAAAPAGACTNIQQRPPLLSSHYEYYFFKFIFLRSWFLFPLIIINEGNANIIFRTRVNEEYIFLVIYYNNEIFRISINMLFWAHSVELYIHRILDPSDTTAQRFEQLTYRNISSDIVIIIVKLK